jgi:hypothetical protein
MGSFVFIFYTKHHQDDVIRDKMGVHVERKLTNEKCVHSTNFGKK